LSQLPADLVEIHAARARIAGALHRTPTLSASSLGRSSGSRLHLKAELFQKTGSFKVRGVLNTLHLLGRKERERGLVSLSAGNHAAALAWAASAMDVAATIVMPASAAPTKIAATRGYGGEVVLTEGNLMQRCREVEAERGLTFVHAFDDPRIMAGHASLGLEILEDVPDVETVVVPVGGGGLIGGVAAAIKLTRPQVRVIGVEPFGADAMTRSLASGKAEQLDKIETIADGLAAPFCGEHTLRWTQRFVDEVVRVSDDAILEALRLTLTRAKLAAEPSGAAAFAALQCGAVTCGDGERVVCVVSGGNIGREALRSYLSCPTPV